MSDTVPNKPLMAITVNPVSLLILTLNSYWRSTVTNDSGKLMKQFAFTCSKSTIETLEKSAQYAQSQQ